ncbi:MAG: lactate dehydrogenase [Clostridiales bacterium]|nr:lactate dehydrogenase [Clostridiales bacterium]
MYYLSDLLKAPIASAEMADINQTFPLPLKKSYRINVLAIGDVGGALLTGLVLLGGYVVDSIGIFDINRQNLIRYEAEMNQIACALSSEDLPRTEILSEEELFRCDVFVFCASKEVPGLDSAAKDVRMAQYSENRKIVEHYARLAASESFEGLFAVVSDPVDPLCKAAYLASGLAPWQFKGFGLGVMNGRARYYAGKDNRFSQYIAEGRAFGPHGNDLVIADSISNYNDSISRELTQIVIDENVRIRQAGFKPFIAPALSSGALSILQMLRGGWHYSSSYVGSGQSGAYFGALNRVVFGNIIIENQPLPEELFMRIEQAYENLKEIE